MQKTYKCKKGHKFKRDESDNVLCPTCNEPAELVKWNTVDESDFSSKNFGLGSALGSIVKDIKSGLK